MQLPLCRGQLSRVEPSNSAGPRDSTGVRGPREPRVKEGRATRADRHPPQPIMGAPAEAPPRTGVWVRVAAAARGRKEFRGSGVEQAAQRSLQAEERSSSLQPGLCPCKALLCSQPQLHHLRSGIGACLQGQSSGWGTGVSSRGRWGSRTNELCPARVEQSLAGTPTPRTVTLPRPPHLLSKRVDECGRAGTH